MWPCSPVPHGPVAQGGISDLWAMNEQPGWLCVLLRPHLACRLPSAAEHPRLPSCPSVAGILAQPPALLSALPPPTEVAPAALPPACSTCSGFFPESRSPPSAPPPPRIPSLSGQHWNAYGVEHRVTTSPAGFGRMQVGSPFPRAHTSHQVHMVGFRSLSATHSHFPSGGHRGCYSHGVWLPWMPAPSACISGVSQGEGARGNSSGVPTGPIP